MGSYVFDGRIRKIAYFTEIMQNKFAVSKIVRIFAVQYRGVEQLVARRAHNPKVVRFDSHPRYQCEFKF